jgi:hypothetical protein
VPGTRVLTIEPVIHIAPIAGQDPAIAAAHVEASFQAWDMVAGRITPGLGGAAELLDVVGVNYYWNNQWLCTHARLVETQWLCDGEPISSFDPRARPLRDLLAEVQRRYGRPILIAETSIEGDHRAAWLRHVCTEARGAMAAGVRLEGVCLYPVLSHPGWDDDRYCPNGLLEMEVQGDRRVEHAPLAAELRRQAGLFEAALASRSTE